MAHNKIRTARMKQKSDSELRHFVEAKTLSSAAAAHELARRGAGSLQHQRNNPEQY